MDKNEAIYRENDANAVGTDTFGDYITAVTVTTTGTLPDEYVESIALVVENTTVVNATTPTSNGTWVLEPDPEAAWIEPADETNVSFEPSIASDAPGGKTLALEIPSVTDADGDGAYDAADTGLFFEQGSPKGGFGPGETLTVPSDGADPIDDLPPLDLALNLPASNVTTATETLSVPITGSESGRAVRGQLVRAETGTVVQSQTVTLDENETATLDFATNPGRYVIQAEAVEGEGTVRSGIFAIEQPAAVGLRPNSTSINRGENVGVNLTLRGVDSATLDLQAPNGTVIESIDLAANGSLPGSVTLDTGGLPGDAAGNHSPARNNVSMSSSRWISVTDNSDATNGSEGESANNRSQRAQATAPEPAAHASNETPSSTSARPTSSDETAEPLDVGTYTLSLTTPDGHRSTATVRVTTEWAAEFETMVAPSGVALSTAEDVRRHATHRDEIAAGDRLVVAISTDGLGTYTRHIAAAGPPTHANASNVANASTPAKARAGNGSTARGPESRQNDTKPMPGYVTLKSPNVEQTPQSSPVADIDRIEHSTSDRFYMIAHPDGQRVEPGTDLAPSLVLTEDSPFLPANATNRSKKSAAGPTVTIVPAAASFAGVSKNGSLDLPAESEVTISGSTTVAPGTTATVHIKGETESFHEEETVTVEEDGTYETTTDFSDYEDGTAYSVSLTADGERLSPLRSGQFVGEGSESAGAAAGGGGGSGSGWSSGDVRTTRSRDSTPTMTERSTTTADGFGPSPVNRLPLAAIRGAWEAVAKPVTFGRTQILILTLSVFVFFSIGVGIRRLGGP